MRFPYDRFFIETSEGDELEIHRPIIHVRIHAPTEILDLECLVDTGADFTLLPRSLADELNIPVDESHSQSIYGIGGAPLPAVRGEIDLELIDQIEVYRWITTVWFISFPSPAEQEVLLGHWGFLDYFTATFDGQRRELELVPNNMFPRPV